MQLPEITDDQVAILTILVGVVCIPLWWVPYAYYLLTRKLNGDNHDLKNRRV